MVYIEGNKEEADNCIEMANKAYYENQYERAEKLLQEADMMYSSMRAKVLLQFVQDAKKEADSRPPLHTWKTKDGFKPTKQRTKPQAGGSSGIKADQEILGVKLNPTFQEIKAAFKTLEVLLQQDTNPDPQAEEAFFAKKTKQFTNQEELEKCITMAAEMFLKGDFKAAETLTKKYIKTDPKNQDKLMKEIWTKILFATNRREVVSNLPQIGEVKKQSRAEYTQKQAEALRRVESARDGNYYELLGLQRGASKNKIESAARKLRGLLSPDVNHFPGAQKAFIKVGDIRDKLIKDL